MENLNQKNLFKTRPIPNWKEGRHDYSNEIVLDVNQGIQTYVTKDEFDDKTWAVFKCLIRKIEDINSNLGKHIYQT